MPNGLHSTDLDREQLEKDHPQFTKAFIRDFLICQCIAFSFTIGFFVAIVNAEKIDKFCYDIFKSIWF
jgi:hypothetical protein